MLAKINTTSVLGLDAFIVKTEADVGSGIPQFDIVGLPDTAVKESKERIQSAMNNAGYSFPLGKVVVNLSPADIRKEGSGFDLPVFMSILKASSQIDFNSDDVAFLGEVSLDGSVEKARGVLAGVIEAQKNGIKSFFVPFDNGDEAAIVDGIDIYPIKTVNEAIDHLNGFLKLTPLKGIINSTRPNYNIDFSEVHGQYFLKKALILAAAGGHNVLLIGPPGSGKSMAAKRIPTIMPDMSFDEALRVTKVHSIAGTLNGGLITNRPFYSPHYTASEVSLTGGGSGRKLPSPGILSLSDGGVLFLDELPEFNRKSREALRSPLEDRQITVTRAAGSITYPVNIILVAAMNPCPCGYFGHPTKKCICSERAIKSYLAKVSGPLLDRLDLHIEVNPVKYEELNSKEKEWSSAEMKKIVQRVIEIEKKRFEGTNIHFNSCMTPKMVDEFCILSPTADKILEAAFNSLGLSARSRDRLLKVARTLADIDGSETIEATHMSEAIQFRSADKKYFEI